MMKPNIVVMALAGQGKTRGMAAITEVIEKQKKTLAAWEEPKKGLLQQMFI